MKRNMEFLGVRAENGPDALATGPFSSGFYSTGLMSYNDGTMFVVFRVMSVFAS
jgi:hypothetical protein